MGGGVFAMLFGITLPLTAPLRVGRRSASRAWHQGHAAVRGHLQGTLLHQAPVTLV
jgi:hypothetical protein